MKQERPFEVLKTFLPENTYEEIIPYFREHTIYLSITRQRKTILGDYRRPSTDKPYHQISVNGNLHPYSFLITLLHELAHMFTYLRYKEQVLPHGQEWKHQFQQMLRPYLGRNFFPADIEKAIVNYLKNPKASTCTDIGLYKALHQYSSAKDKGWCLVGDLPLGAIFKTAEAKSYQIIAKRRTRYQCEEIKTGKMYLFPMVYEVYPIHTIPTSL